MDSMAGRPSKLGARVLKLVLILFGPLGVVIGLGSLGLGLDDSTGKGLLLLALIWLFCSLLLAPEFLFPNSGPPARAPESEGEGDGGGGSGGGNPPQPSPRPGAPRGGIPLPDAEQSRLRVRDHDRPARRRLRPRRPAREPDRTPARTVPHR